MKKLGIFLLSFAFGLSVFGQKFQDLERFVKANQGKEFFNNDNPYPPYKVKGGNKLALESNNGTNGFRVSITREGRNDTKFYLPSSDYQRVKGNALIAFFDNSWLTGSVVAIDDLLFITERKGGEYFIMGVFCTSKSKLEKMTNAEIQKMLSTAFHTPEVTAYRKGFSSWKGGSIQKPIVVSAKPDNTPKYSYKTGLHPKKIKVTEVLSSTGNMNVMSAAMTASNDILITCWIHNESRYYTYGFPQMNGNYSWEKFYSIRQATSKDFCRMIYSGKDVLFESDATVWCNEPTTNFPLKKKLDLPNDDLLGFFYLPNKKQFIGFYRGHKKSDLGSRTLDYVTLYDENYNIIEGWDIDNLGRVQINENKTQILFEGYNQVEKKNGWYTIYLNKYLGEGASITKNFLNPSRSWSSEPHLFDKNKDLVSTGDDFYLVSSARATNEVDAIVKISNGEAHVKRFSLGRIRSIAAQGGKICVLFDKADPNAKMVIYAAILDGDTKLLSAKRIGEDISRKVNDKYIRWNPQRSFVLPDNKGNFFLVLTQHTDIQNSKFNSVISEYLNQRLVSSIYMISVND